MSVGNFAMLPENCGVEGAAALRVSKGESRSCIVLDAIDLGTGIGELSDAGLTADIHILVLYVLKRSDTSELKLM